MKREDIERVLMGYASRCGLCPRRCGIDRNERSGFCATGAMPAIYQHFMHMGEEAVLVPAFIINMCGCNLSCPTCPERHRWMQRLPIPAAEDYARALARHFRRAGMPRSLEWIGGEPSVQIPYVVKTTWALRDILGAEMPPVYLNSNMYFDPGLFPLILDDESPSIDAFVFDFKAERACCRALTGCADYCDVVVPNIERAVRMRPDAPHIMRHLVVPGHLECCTKPIMAWCRAHIPDVAFNLMTGFFDFRADSDGPKYLSEEEKRAAVDAARNNGFKTLFIDGEE